jgi:hypothetical protein
MPRPNTVPLVLRLAIATSLILFFLVLAGIVRSCVQVKSGSIWLPTLWACALGAVSCGLIGRREWARKSGVVMLLLLAFMSPLDYFSTYYRDDFLLIPLKYDLPVYLRVIALVATEALLLFAVHVLGTQKASFRRRNVTGEAVKP